MSEFVTTLDQALDRLHRGEGPAAILADYPAQAESLGELLTTALALDILRPAPLPAAADLAADREEFLAELAQLVTPDVSVGPLVRLNRWITQHPLPSLIQTYLFKEQRRMNTLLIKAMLVLTLVFGAASGAVAASAHSLPGGPLYPLKLGLEEASLALTGDPVQQAGQWQERVRERAAEISQMAVNGQTVGEAELARLQTQTQACLQQMANLPDPVMGQQLERFQQMTQQQQQLLEQTGGSQVQAAAQTMAQARQAAGDGLADPAAFRYRYGLHRPDEAPPQPTLTPGAGRQATPPEATPVRPVHTPQPTGDAHRYGPQPTQPGPGQPGGNPEATCTPTGDAHRYGPQPTQPGPGQPGGNPAGQSTPTGDAHRYGPQPTQPGPGQPGGNPEATCTPIGNANRYGPQTATPQPSSAPGASSGSDNSGNSGASGGSDDSGGSGGSSDSGGNSGDTGGSGGSDNSGSSGGSSDPGGNSGDTGSSGGSDDSGGSGGSSGSGSSGGSGDSGGSSGGSSDSGGGRK